MHTSKDQDWIWGREQCHSFETLKQRLDSAPVLRRPNITKAFQLHTDWSALGLEVVFIQKDDVG